MANDCENRLANLIHAQQWHMDRLYSEYSEAFGSIYRNYTGRDNKAKERELDRFLNRFQDDLQRTIQLQIDASINLANICNNNLTQQYFKNSGIDTKLIEKSIGNNAAMEGAARAFALRSTSDQFNLSERVWNLKNQTKESISHVLQSGVLNGRDARSMAKDLKQYLKEPDRRFRRVRNSEGKLVLSNPAKSYHPGRGVYRSSYKNALRLSRTEVNMAYRRADYERRKNLDFVMGHRVSLSAAHPRYDICDELQGKYPKDFIFTGWHPQCLCISTALLYPPDKFKQHLETGHKINPQYETKKIPKRASDYIKENSGKIASYKSPPYFIRDNFVQLGDKSGQYVAKADLAYDLTYKKSGPRKKRVKQTTGPEPFIVPDQFKKLGLNEELVEKMNNDSFKGGYSLRQFIDSKKLNRDFLFGVEGWLGSSSQILRRAENDPVKQAFLWGVKNIRTKHKTVWRGLDLGYDGGGEKVMSIYKQLKSKKKFSFGKSAALIGDNRRDMRLASASSEIKIAQNFSNARSTSSASVIVEYRNEKGIKGIRLGHLYGNTNGVGSEHETIIGDSFNYDVIDVKLDEPNKVITLILKQNDNE